MAQYNQNQILDDNVAITATRDSTNHLMIAGASGTGTFNNLEAVGNDLYVDFIITQAFATLTSLTIGIFDSADDSTYSTIPVVTTGAIPVANLVPWTPASPLNGKISLELPPTTRKYIKAIYTVGGSNATAGKIFAALLSVRNNSL
jgi:hypothetical protein